MELNALLLSTDPAVHTLMQRVLANVGIRTELSVTPAAGLRLLKSKKFEGIIVDCDDIDCGGDLLGILRGEGFTRNAIVFAIVNGSTSMSDAFGMGANFVLEKPLSAERANRCFKAACGLMVGERRRYYRHGIDIPIYLDFPKFSNVTAHMQDLSQGGTMLQCSLALELDMQGTFRFTLPETRREYYRRMRSGLEVGRSHRVALQQHIEVDAGGAGDVAELEVRGALSELRSHPGRIVSFGDSSITTTTF